jgi:hypothetical protein
MTQEEKFTTIVAELGDSAKEFAPLHLSLLIIFDYMDILFANGIIAERPVEIEEQGKAAAEVCRKHEWEVSDADIVAFCRDMVNKDQIESFLMMLRAMRDDQEKFLEHAKKHIDLNI